MPAENDPKELYRKLTGVFRIVTIVFPAAAILLSAYYLFRITWFGIVLMNEAYYFLLIGLLLPLTFLLLPATAKASREKLPWYDIVAACLIFGISLYFSTKVHDIVQLTWAYAPPTYVYPLALVLLVAGVEGSRRVGGPVFAAVSVFFLIYPMFARIMPGILAGVQFSFNRTITLNTFGSEGILGIPMRTIGGMVIGYFVFAAALQAFGIGQFFANIALAVLGHVRGGTAKVAVFTSALFGMISGSPGANIAVAGSYTIPAMMKTGYSKEYAAAIEATASTGGVIMPPVMGTVAFVMAEFLGMPYGVVAIAAILPALLYYFAIYLQIDCHAARIGLRGMPRESLPSARAALKEGWYFIFVILFLVYMLMVQFKESQAPYYTIPLLIGLPMLSKKTRLSAKKIFVDFPYLTGRLLLFVVPTLLGVGFIMNGLTVTGLSNAFSGIILDLAGGNIYLLLLFGAVTSFILGMGMTAVACYVVLALLLAPSLVQAGMDPLAVHMFIMYWGMVSFITPPVAVAVFLAAAIARSSVMKTGWRAVRLGVGMYLIPFLFVLYPSLILRGPPVNIVYSVCTALLSMSLLSFAAEGYIFKLGKIGLWVRMFLLVGGMSIGFPDLRATALGLLLSFSAMAIALTKKKATGKIVAADRV